MRVQLLDNPSLLLEWSEAPWDSRLFGSPVLQLTRIEVRGSESAAAFEEFERARDAQGCRFVSCRLESEQLAASMMLEDRGFRYIETVYTPELALQGQEIEPTARLLRVLRGSTETLSDMLAIAGRAFRNERFHVDPRLDHSIGDQRYMNWVASCLDHPVQELYGLWEADRLVAFFVIEMKLDGTCYWHLNAVAPDAQGQGYGRRAWLTMIALAQRNGAQRIRSSIVARNVRVLNLYAQLGFRFMPPQMTLHWVAQDSGTR